MKLLGLRRQLAAQLLVSQTCIERIHLQIDDLDDIFLRQRLIEDDLVQTVQELGAELALEQLVNGVSGLVGQLVAAELGRVGVARPFLQALARDGDEVAGLGRELGRLDDLLAGAAHADAHGLAVQRDVHLAV